MLVLTAVLLQCLQLHLRRSAVIQSGCQNGAPFEHLLAPAWSEKLPMQPQSNHVKDDVTAWLQLLGTQPTQAQRRVAATCWF